MKQNKAKTKQLNYHCYLSVSRIFEFEQSCDLYITEKAELLCQHNR